MIAAIAAMAIVADWGSPTALCSLEREEINESSGLACSFLYDDVYYTHNDSGDTARFFRFSASGAITGTFGLANVTATDWEAMASAKVSGVSYLYLGDIGDNARKRKAISIHRVAEPKGSSRDLPVVETYTITYPDAPHDCEALFVEPGVGNIWLVTKAREGVTYVYRIEKPTREGIYEAEMMGQIPVDTGGLGGRLVTGGEAAPNGLSVVLRTYTGALEYPVVGDFETWMKSKPKPISLTKERQGEAICFSRDGSKLLTSSEGIPCPITVYSKKRRA